MTAKHQICSASPTRPQQGFTLLELMVVVAIIAILAMIALPQYQKFAKRAKYSAALAEIAPGKAGVEAHIAEGRYHRLQSYDVGLGLSSANCERINIDSDDFMYNQRVEIICELTWGSFSPDTLSLVREHTGEWRCTSNIYDESLLPEVCRA